jgi:hypothetical protein
MEQRPTYASQENGNDLAVLVPFLTIGPRGKRESLAEAGLNRGRGRGSEISELVGGADNERADGAGRHFDEVYAGARVRASSVCFSGDGQTYGTTPQAPCTQNCSKKATAMTASLAV